jgi:hypothetical protein
MASTAGENQRTPRGLTIFPREIAFSRVPMMGFESISRLRWNGF